MIPSSSFLLLLLGAPLLFLVTSAQDDSRVRLYQEGGRYKRQMYSLGTKWGDNTVKYQYNVRSENIGKTMKASMNYIANRTCIKFEENPSASQRIIILDMSMGCSSQVGAPGTRANNAGTANLIFSSCPTLGDGVHELLHSLGAYHEHTRPDRNSYLYVDQALVNKYKEQANMNAKPWGMVDLLVPFEYGSVMMYHTNMFGPKLMTANDPKYERTMGNRRVSFYDMVKVNKYYGCSCSTDLPCANNGYTSPSDCSTCVCPKGFFGKLCDQHAPDGYELAATSDWQSKDVSFNFKDTGDNYNYLYSTFAYVSAPNGKTVEIELTNTTELACKIGCNENGVEVKTNEDNRSVSPIVCCQDQQFGKETFTSKNNPTIIEFFSSKTKTTTVGFRYRYV